MARSVGLPAIPQGLQIQGAFDHQPTKTEDAKKQVGPAEPARERANEQETPKLPVRWKSTDSVMLFSPCNMQHAIDHFTVVAAGDPALIQTFGLFLS